MRMMRMGWLAGVLCALCAAGRGDGAAFRPEAGDGLVDAFVCTDPDAADARCAVANVEQPSGTVLEVLSPMLPRGRYRLTLRAKLSDLGTINTAPLTFKVSLAGATPVRVPPDRGEGAEFGFDVLAFGPAGVYRNFEFDLLVPSRGEVGIALGWQRRSILPNSTRGTTMQATEQPDVASRADGLGDVSDDDDDLDALAPEPELSTVTHLFLAVDTLSLVRTSAFPVERLQPDRIRYRPGEQARVDIAVANGSGAEATVMVETALVREADTVLPVETKTLALKAGGAESWTVTTAPLNEPWGYAVRTRVLAEDGTVLGERSEYFTVHDNMWAVLIAGRSPAQFTANITRESARASALSNMFRYRNWVESGFWAPDEFGDFAPTTERWFGGQGCYVGGREGTKAMIEEGHARGISFAVYSNIWGGDGPPAFEMVRRHPDTGYAASFNAHWFDRWDRNPKGNPDAKTQSMHVWPFTCVSYADKSFALHGRALIEGHRMFGWDAVRYDSHGLSDGNARAVRITQETVHAEFPGFRFGFNSSTPLGDEKQLPSFIEHCRGGNLIMEEGIRNYGKDQRTYREFAERILAMRTETRAHGGHFLAIGLDVGFPDDALYQHIFWLAANTHPCYDWQRPSTGDYFQFATRHAAFLWDLAVQPVEDAAGWVTFSGGKEWLWMPEAYVSLRKLADGRAQLIIQLINAPLAEKLSVDATCAVPPPRKGIEVGIHPPGFRVERGWCMTAEPELTQTPLTLPAAGGPVVTPELRFWNMLVFDLVATEGQP